MKKTKTLLSFVFIAFIGHLASGQQTAYFGCATESLMMNNQDDILPRNASPLPSQSNCNKSSNAYNDFFKRPDNYMYQNFYRPGISPSAYYPNRTEPKKTVVINIVFFGEDNGTGFPMQPSANPDVATGSLINSWLNEHNTNTQASNVTVCHPISITNTGLEIRINKVYFYSNSNHLHATQSGASGSPWTNAQNAMTYHLSHNPDAQNQINCIIVQYCGYPQAMGFASTMTYNGTSIPYVYSGSNYFNMNYGQEWVAGYSMWAQHLPHEIGHHLGMWHPYESDESAITNYDRLIDLFPCTGSLAPSNNNFMAAQGGNHVSSIQAGRMHRALSTDLGWGISRHYAYGHSEIPYILETDEIWDFTYKSYQDIIIPNGKTLTITCKLEMVPNSKIFVEPGGQLIVDGGLITAAKCGGKDYEGYWQGIELHGDNTKPQIESYQGKVVLKNGAIIEFAREAIMPWKYNDWSKTGGIIEASNATFRNNKRSIQYMAYQNFMSSNAVNESPNRGKFVECKFIWDDDAFEGGFQPAITLNGVKGVQITGCVFQDKRTNIGITERAVGIYSIDAGYAVKGKFTGNINSPIQAYYSTTNYIVGEFIDMYKGIEITGSGTLYSNIVDHVKFTNCNYGIYVHGTDNPTITRNEFNYKSPLPAGLTAPTSVKVENSTGFKVEGNHFYNDLGTSLAVYGSVVSSAGEAQNLVYKNKYDKNFLANQAVLYNRSNDVNFIRGLQYLCNDNVQNRYDMNIQTYSDLNAGVRSLQGELTTASQNLLSVSPIRHIVTTDNVHPMKYYWKGVNNQPTLITQPQIVGSNAINVIPAPFFNECKSNFTNGGVILHDDKVLELAEKTSMKATRDNLVASKNTLENDFFADLAAGDASSLYNLIATINLSNANDVKNALLANSPYLSHHLLTNLGEVSTTLFPKSWYLDVIKANIEVFEVPEFRLFLMTKNEPLDGDDMLILAEAYKNNPTARLLEQNNIAQLTEKMATIDNWLLIDELNNEPTDVASIIPALIADREDVAANAQKLGYYFGLRDWVNFDNALLACQNQIASMENNRLQHEINDVMVVLSYLKNQQNAFGSYDIPMSQSQVDQLLTYRNELSGKAQVYASNVLCFYASVCEEDDRDEMEATSAKQQIIQFDPSTSQPISLQLHPNPTNGVFTIQNEASGIAHVEILNMQGQQMNFSVIYRNENTIEIALGEIKDGVYILQVRDKKGKILVNRFVKN